MQKSKNGWRLPLEYVAALSMITEDMGIVQAALAGTGMFVLDKEGKDYYELGKITAESRVKSRKTQSNLWEAWHMNTAENIERPDIEIKVWLLRNEIPMAQIGREYGCDRRFVSNFVKGKAPSKGLAKFMIKMGCPAKYFKNGRGTGRRECSERQLTWLKKRR